METIGIIEIMQGLFGLYSDTSPTMKKYMQQKMENAIDTAVIWAS